MAIVGLMGVTSKSVVVVSTAACGRRLGGGLALDGLFTGLDRAPERTGDSAPRHIPSPTSLRAHHCVPSSVHVRPCSKGPHSPTSSGSAFPIKNGSEFSIGPNPLFNEEPLDLRASPRPAAGRKRGRSWDANGDAAGTETGTQLVLTACPRRGRSWPCHPPWPPTAVALAVVGSSRERPGHPDRVRLRCPKSFAPSGLLWPHVLVGCQWSHTGLRPGRKTSHNRYIRSFVSQPPWNQGDPRCSFPPWPPGPRQGWAAGSDRFWLLELRVSRTFLDQLRPQLSGHGYPARRGRTADPDGRGAWGGQNSGQ